MKRADMPVAGADAGAPAAAPARQTVGAVAIGRNEGERRAGSSRG